MKTIARRRLLALEREWNYDAGYMHEILDAGGLEALMAVANLDKLSNCPARHSGRTILRG